MFPCYHPRNRGDHSPQLHTAVEVVPSSCSSLKHSHFQVRSFKGKPLIDIRELYMGPKGPAPGKKGISLSVTEWRALCDLMEDVDEEILKIT